MKIFANYLAVLASLNGMKYTYLVSLSVIMRIESYISPVVGSLDIGSLMTKSKAIDFQGCFGVSTG
jgi:hypothetical protein